MAKPSPQTPQASQSPRLPIAFWVMLALTVAIRLPGIDRPLVGNFATKNAMYAMIARNWVEGRAGLLHPTLDCMVGGKRSLHMLELSVSAHVTGCLWTIFGGSLDVWGRATAVAFCVGSVTLLFLFVRGRHGTTAALGAGFVLALSPVSVIYGQMFMLDASLVFFTVATFYGVDRWLKSGRLGWLTAASVCFALLLLTKVYMVVLLLPLGVTVVGATRARPAATEANRSSQRTYAVAMLAAALAVLPVALWCVHVLQTISEGSPWAAHVYSSLRGNAQAYRPPDPLLFTPDFYRQILDDLTGVMLTPLGLALFLAGFLDRSWRRHAAWLAAMVILIVALPRKFYDMNYYDVALMPPLCVVAGLGWRVVSEGLRLSRKAAAAVVLIATALCLRYAVRPAFVTPDEDRAVVAAGRAVERLTEPEEPVVTVHGATIDLLYYCNRPGWAVEPDTPGLDSVLADCAEQGARYVVVAGPEAATGV
ncbi:MAG: glycosyltransferase family 39 protein, partial [Planctomycetota bacterium]